MSDRYDVNIIFRGLILAQPVNNRLAILLPDARNPRQLVPSDEERRELERVRALNLEQTRSRLHGALSRYREHHGLIEFNVDDWKNSGQHPAPALRLQRRGGPEVMMYMIGGNLQGSVMRHRLRFLSEAGERFGPPSSLTGPQQHYNQSLSSSNDLLILEGTGPFSYHHLPPFMSGVATDAWERSIAFASFESGEVFSKRRCTDSLGNPHKWTLASIQQVAFRTGKPGEPETRPINLDLHIRFSLRRNDALRLRVETVPAGAGTSDLDVPFLPQLPETLGGEEFLLKPADSAPTLVIQVKNRELSQAMFEDAAGNPVVQEAGLPVFDDIDHGLFMQLADEPQRVVIPRRVAGGPIANTGCACGVCGGGSGGPGGGA